MPRRLQLVIFALASLWSASALAAYRVESGPSDSRSDATALLDGLGSGVEGRVVRSFERGVGWTYRVVVDDIAELGAARAVASTLARDGRPGSVLESEGGESRLVEVVPVGAPSAAAAPTRLAPSAAAAASAPSERRPDVDSVLRAAVRAHGGEDGGLVFLHDQPAVRFAFERTVTLDGVVLRTRNTFSRQGESLRLDVEILEGEGKDSVTVLSREGGAWVRADGVAVEREVARTREVLQRFSPEVMLAMPLGLPQDVDTGASWRGLEVQAAGADDAGSLVVGPAEARDEGLSSANFDPRDHTLQRVVWQGGAGTVVFSYADYRKVERRLVVPFEARVTRDGQQVELVTVTEFSLEPVFTPEFFAKTAAP